MRLPFMKCCLADLQRHTYTTAGTLKSCQTGPGIEECFRAFSAVLVAPRLHDASPRRRSIPSPSRRGPSAYLVVWSAFRIGAGILEWLLTQQDLIRESSFANPVLSGGLLLLAGAYQWSGAKNFCLRRCRSPLGFMLQHYASGCRGALQLGLRHGAFCVGCCWALMLLAWVGGHESHADVRPHHVPVDGKAARRGWQ
jgi:hypothetical protein